MSGRKPKIIVLFGARVLYGQERANVEALSALQNEGCDVLFVIRPEEWPELLEVRRYLDDRGLTWTTAPYVDYPVKGWIGYVLINGPGQFWQGNRKLCKIISEFGATHIHAFNPWFVFGFYFALRRSTLPMVYRCGDLPIVHNILNRFIWRFIKKRAACFVCDSEFICREVIATGVRPSRVQKLFSPPPSRRSTTPFNLDCPELKKDTMVFTFIGQVIPEKGVGILIDAFKKLHQYDLDTCLLIAGRIPDWEGDSWARDVRARVDADPRIRSVVHFLGFVEDIPGLLKHTNVHLLPSILQEAYGLVIIEAKSAGKPSIVFPNGGMPELIEDGISGLIVADKSPEGLANAMKTYCDDRGLASVHGKAAYDSLKGFNFQKFGKRWRKVYDSCQ